MIHRRKGRERRGIGVWGMFLRFLEIDGILTADYKDLRLLGSG
jgi:hypothetical protein